MQELTNPQSPEWLLNQVTLDAFEKQEQQNTSGTPLLSGTMFSNGRRNTDSIKLLGLLARNNMDSGTKEIAFKAFINALPDKMDEAEINSLLNSSERYDASSIQPLTERSFATTLYSQIKNKFVLVKSNGFYRFNGRHWELDENNKHILNFAYHVGDKMNKFKFVMRMFGSAFVAKGIEQKVFFLVGKGSNGKSVLVNVIDDIMGDLKLLAVMH